MKITSARTTVVGTPWRELVFLELETDTGLVGTSEVRMVSRTLTLLACLEELAPRHVIGTDPFQLPFTAVSVEPTCATPVIDGATMFTGGWPPTCPVTALVATPGPPALLAVTTTRMVCR